MVGLFILSMLLSNVVNNAAAALLMAPIAVSLANGFDVSLDPFNDRCSECFLCLLNADWPPVKHPCARPRGYQFGDYWKLGLPLSVVVLVVSIPMILWVWPLSG